MRYWLGLGSNLGDRQANLRAALDQIRTLPATRVATVSPVYETEPVGELNQNAFLNLAAEVETALQPLELLNAAKEIEKFLGRTPTRRWGPRTVDIDLILWDGPPLQSPALTLPHREFRARRFVLAPLADIAPDLLDPTTGLTIQALLDAPDVVGAVKRVAVDIAS